MNCRAVKISVSYTHLDVYKRQGMYRELVKMNRQNIIDFGNVTTFNLDEYIGLNPDHPQSYHYYMHHHLFDHVNIPAERIYICLLYTSQKK